MFVEYKMFEWEVQPFRLAWLCFCLVALVLLFSVGGRGDIELSRSECSGRVVHKASLVRPENQSKNAEVVTVQGDGGVECMFSVQPNREGKFYREAGAALAGIEKDSRVKAVCIRSNYAKQCEIIELKKNEVVVLSRAESHAADAAREISANNKRLKDFLIPLFLVLTCVELWVLSRRPQRKLKKSRDR